MTGLENVSLRRIKTAFRKYSMRRDLAEYQFDLHADWWVTHKPTGATWVAMATTRGIDFDQLVYGEE